MKKTPAKRATKAKIKNSGVGTPAQWLLDWARQGVVSSSGESVNERTALGISAYLACIKNISEDEGKLPLCLYERMQPRGRRELPNHPVDRLIRNQPNSEMTAMTFRQTITAHALGWHGGFAEIVRDGRGVPTALWPLDPTCVQVMREQYGSRQMFYWVTPSPAFGELAPGGIRFAPEDIFHIHGLGYNGVSGYVMARLAKDAIGNAIASQKFSGSFFANGATSTGILEVPDALSETALKHLRESLVARYQGAANQHKTMVLEQGTKYVPISNDPQKSQLVESLYQGVEEVARLFRMPPHKIGHLLRATFTNIEQQALEYITDCLLGWLVRWEQEIWRKLLLPREQATIFAKHNVNMLMRGDAAARSTFYREMFNIGAYSDNDIRECEDMNPVDGGDTYFVNAAMVPLDMAAEGEHLPQTQTDSTGNEPPDEANTPASYSAFEHKKELLGRVAAAHTKTLSDAIGGILRVEHDKVRRAAKRDDFGSWSSHFYGNGHKTEACERLGPVFAAMNASMEAVSCN